MDVSSSHSLLLFQYQVSRLMKLNIITFSVGLMWSCRGTEKGVALPHAIFPHASVQDFHRHPQLTEEKMKESMT
jgi:hypothetical protein